MFVFSIPIPLPSLHSFWVSLFSVVVDDGILLCCAVLLTLITRPPAIAICHVRCASCVVQLIEYSDSDSPTAMDLL